MQILENQKLKINFNKWKYNMITLVNNTKMIKEIIIVKKKIQPTLIINYNN